MGRVSLVGIPGTIFKPGLQTNGCMKTGQGGKESTAGEVMKMCKDIKVGSNMCSGTVT